MRHLTIIAACLAFALGALLGYTAHGNREEVESLRRRIRETELIMWSWRGELDALKAVGVEVRIIDVSHYADIIRADLTRGMD
jgi:hypothetical protein